MPFNLIRWRFGTVAGRGGEAARGTLEPFARAGLVDSCTATSDALLWAIGAVRWSRPLPNPPRAIALCVLEALGDTLLTSAPAEDIRRVMPDARITLVAATSNQAMAPTTSRIVLSA